MTHLSEDIVQRLFNVLIVFWTCNCYHSSISFMFMAVEDCHAYLLVCMSYLYIWNMSTCLPLQCSSRHYVSYISSALINHDSLFIPLNKSYSFFSFIELRQLSFYICVNLCCSYFQAVPWNFDQFLQTSQEVEWQTTAVFLCPLRFCVLVYFLGKLKINHYKLQINWIIV